MNLLETKEFLNSLHEEYNEYELVNGEEGEIDDEFNYRLDKPVISIAVDEETKEIIFLMNQINNWGHE